MVMSLLHGNADLTSREWAITALVSEGRTNTEIADALQTTEQVVETHLRRIFEKTGCWNRTEIALWYVKLGVRDEKRSSDRREANWETGSERRQVERRHGPQPAPRVNEKHEMNMDE
jgi:DNA-binding CsgD family transcriptional regulator